MIVKIADNIISPLGYTTQKNFEAVVSGDSRIMCRKGFEELPEEFYGSLFNREEVAQEILKEIGEEKELTFFEKLCVCSAKKAIDKAGIDASDENVVFVLSTTKGNVAYLTEAYEDSRCYIGGSAERIASYFNNPNTPVVVSNACISGVSAQITAVRLLLSGKYTTAVVTGCDVLSRFIVSGFQSFKALSSQPCRPFDKDRTGLNLGEAAGTIILQSRETADINEWHYVSSSVHNDANHISGPSRTGEGSYRVLRDITAALDKNSIAFINVHGTSTAYNDEMESIAIHRAGLDSLPVTGLKGNYGHTLGAAGIIETILSMKAAEHGVILPTKGYEKQGTTYAVNVSPEVRQTDKTVFLKIMSGFGGTNAGICYEKGGKV